MTKHNIKGHVAAKSRMTAKAHAVRGVNALRVAVLGVLLAFGVGVAAVAASLDASWWVAALVGAGSTLLSMLILGWARSRNWLMSLLHRITGG